MRKLHFIDSYSTKELHELFNSSSLMMFSKLYDRVEYYASKTSSLNTKKIIQPFPTTISIHNIPVIPYEPGYKALLKQLLATIVNIYLLIKIPKRDVVLFNYNTILSLKPINFINRYLKKKVIIICHGELESLSKPLDQTFGGRKLKSFFLNSNLNLSNDIYFFVLGESIKKNVIRLVDKQFTNRFYSFEHTAIFKNRMLKKYKDSECLNVAFLGSMRDNKGIDQILKLVQRFENNIKIKFTIIGRIRTDISIINKLGINYINGADKFFLSRKLMDNEMENQDIILFMYPTDSYKFTASGALLDAIGYEKPILSLPNDYFNYVMNKRISTGKILNNDDEIYAYLNFLINNPLPTYNFQEIKSALSPISEAKNLIKTLRSIKLL
ncbi:glycosyltransferase family 4 protein [Maribacter sp. MAR_2009_72]|uniref:glycosyltransferase family 4 protein n=1 Tax=Maribacter sp. MAR_2009_72 TaxID=1250050 RepID=UPI00119AF441|nr:glycosyltransferase family 4 protein [Maribacter sp. MAR_2009_72]TVZ16942.1 glycosyltransferase involved in cell wall biosynthesis [Maribacter sp. MAR_2009_72]